MLKKNTNFQFKPDKKEMKGLGEVNVYRYRHKENEKAKVYKMKIILKFQALVNKVIADLKARGVIKYKKFVAANFFTEFQEKERERMNSQMRRSTTKEKI